MDECTFAVNFFSDITVKNNLFNDTKCTEQTSFLWKVPVSILYHTHH